VYQYIPAQLVLVGTGSHGLGILPRRKGKYKTEIVVILILLLLLLSVS
jgi:hypothetical protein